MLVSLDLGLSRCLIDGTERLLLVKQSPQTAVSFSCPPLHCSICSSDFIYQPLLNSNTLTVEVKPCIKEDA